MPKMSSVDRAISKRIGLRMKMLRERAGLRQYEVAEVLEMTAGNYSAVERGEAAGATVYVVDKLCNYYKVDANFFFCHTEEDTEEDALVLLARKARHLDEGNRSILVGMLRNALLYLNVSVPLVNRRMFLVDSSLPKALRHHKQR